MLREDELQGIGRAMIQAEVLGGTLEARLVAFDVRALLATIRELQAQVPHWIPVSERLPEMVRDAMSADVIVATATWGTFQAWYEHDKAEWWSSAYDGPLRKVLAWMPIPDTSQVLEP